MAYKIIVSLNAQREIENAIDYYALHSHGAPAHFITAIKETFETLETNPFFCVRYKNIRAIKIRKFPYSLYFIVNEERKTVRILSCFHNKRNPVRRIEI
jgi:toxin ParE1/3/4